LIFFNILATFAEFEAGLIRMRTREGMAIAPPRQGEITRQAVQTV
jgi:DNA invertase Pin-like site-specific DNA recombinase